MTPVPGLYRVKSTELNLRSTPAIKPSNRLAVLAHGAVVTRMGNAQVQDWWRVTAVLHAVPVIGFVASRFLEPVEAPPPEPATGVRAVHLTSDAAVVRASPDRRAYPLNEPNQPQRSGPDSDTLAAIVAWLRVERSLRYLPAAGQTFCNIYAYDYCCLAGAYLPRVWWTAGALADLRADRAVPVAYGTTVRELNANGLCDWLEDFGPEFGWNRTFSLDSLQNAANQGSVALVVARRADPNRSGHIVAVVPETASRRAVRTGGAVTIPLQSQAGATNFRYSSATGAWWRHTKFSRFGLWMHS